MISNKEIVTKLWKACGVDPDCTKLFCLTRVLQDLSLFQHAEISGFTCKSAFENSIILHYPEWTVYHD